MSVEYPNIAYGLSSPQDEFDFAVPPYVIEYVPEAKTFDAWVPGADLNSDTEHVQNHLFVNDIIYVDMRLIVESDIDDYWDWWAWAVKGYQFTFTPDKDSPGTSYNVIQIMGKFNPKPKDGLYSFGLKFLVVAA